LKKLIRKDNADSANRVMAMFGGGATSPEDASTVARAQLTKLRANIRVTLPASKGLSRYHLEDCLAQISDILDNKK
jgi:hypothetical protein